MVPRAANYIGGYHHNFLDWQQRCFATAINIVLVVQAPCPRVCLHVCTGLAKAL